MFWLYYLCYNKWSLWARWGPKNVHFLPWILVTRVISNSDDSLSMFDLNPDQYILAFKNLKGVPHTFPICAHVDLTLKHYKNIKVFFKNKWLSSLTGHLTQFQPELAENDSEQRFIIMVTNFDFMRYTPPLSAASFTPLNKSVTYFKRTGLELTKLSLKTHRYNK